jgi:hypothetical protein
MTAAIHIQRRAGDVGRQIGSQEHAGRRDFVRTPGTPERNRGTDVADTFLWNGVGNDISFDQGWTDRIYAHARRPEFACEGFGQTEYAAL